MPPSYCNWRLELLSFITLYSPLGMGIRLRQWAERHGLAYGTAYKHFQKGLIPGAFQLPTGTIVIPDPPLQIKTEWVVTYARVSSSQNKTNLDSQSERLIKFCNAKGLQTHQNVKEIGSGLNGSRKKLLKLLKDGKATKLVVEHKDRLARFGSEYIEILCEHVGCELIIINSSDLDDDLMQDFVSLVTSFCARIYGRHRGRRKTEQIIQKLEDSKDSR